MRERRIFSQRDLDIEIPEYTFRPNVWTEAFLTGFQSVAVENKRVVEIGVGTGIVGIELLKRGVQEYVGLDIDERIIHVAQRNIAKEIPESTQKITLLQSDLLESVPHGQYFDIVCGCLPQIGKLATMTLGVADSYARYFDAEKYQSALNVYGLGLNEGALIQAKTRLTQQGNIVLVLSGRAGKDVLEQLFVRNGYTFEDTIPQLRETTLKALVEAEDHGSEFFFYKDALCEDRISVMEAEERRLNGQDSYHKIYVLEGTLAERV